MDFGLWTHASGRRRRSEGVALVITLIFLAVITFMAVTFLVIARRERERAITQTTQNDAKFATDVGLEYFKAWLVASTLGRNNSYDLGLVVSTNYINPLGFDPSKPVNNITNVSYMALGGGPVLAKDMPKLVSNLRILPRVPVFVSTNQNPAFPPDFRFYLDLNRNGVYDTNGFGTNYFLGQYLKNPDGSFQTNNFVGDPEWIGVLNNPEQCSSPSNLFVARYAFIAIPIGNTLDLNYIHNQAKQPSRLQDGFLRNEGYGSWELNLAGFFRYLNTNGVWTYNYANANLANINSQSSSIGTAFDDAATFVMYRYGTKPLSSWHNLANFDALYNFKNAAARAFPFDYIDVYSRGPLWVNAHSPTNFPENANTVLTAAWSGADNPTHFFSTQDLFTYTNQLPNNVFLGQVSGKSNFVDRINALSSHTNNSDERYTFYKMLAQAGFDSPAETNNKINLNFASVGGTNPTSFVPWTPVNFFTNTATKLLQTLGTPYPTNLSTAFIPVWPTNFSLYDSAVHRMLQLAANIYDATTNRPFRTPNPDRSLSYYPSVFRPIFGRTNINLGLGSSNVNIIYISGYEEVTNLNGANDPVLSKPLSLPDDIVLQPKLLPNNSATNRVNIYGVPWIIGAKKGLPNFNQFASQTFSHITRRLDVDKSAGTARTSWKTNQMYIIGVSNLVALDAWNSYVTNFPRAVSMFANDDLRMGFNVYNTNNPTPIYSTTLAALQPLAANQSYFAPYTNIAASSWTGFNSSSKNPNYNAPSFRSFRSNIVFLPDMQYRVGTRTLVPTNSGAAQFEPLTTGPLPQFVLTVTNRFRMVLLDAIENRVLDYVQFGGADASTMDTSRNLTAELTQNTQNDPLGVWNQSTASRGGPVGPINQIQISSGAIPVSTADWNNAQIHSSTDQSKADAISGFNNWLNGGPGAATNKVMEVPFTPTAEYSETWSWQANDPLVHYITKDLNSPNNTGTPISLRPPDSVSAVSSNYLQTGTITARYQPWGYLNKGNPKAATDLTLKDPLVINSDAWDFPTNKFASIGELGRVHRGTPWQTIYLKAQTNTVGTWEGWTLNTNFLSRTATQPTNDWKVLDLFTVAPNDNATRGRLSINQSGMAAWAAALQGVVTLTNTPSANLPYSPLVIDPNLHDAQFQYIVNGINQMRATYPGGVFTNLGDILSVPQLTTASPFINPGAGPNSVSDAVYERIPAQILSLLKVGEARYLVFCYGQSLKPADRSVFQGAGQQFGVVTNYQVTGEYVTRAVVRITDQTRALPTLPNPQLGIPQHSPQVIVESFNTIGPDQ